MAGGTSDIPLKDMQGDISWHIDSGVGVHSINIMGDDI